MQVVTAVYGVLVCRDGEYRQRRSDDVLSRCRRLFTFLSALGAYTVSALLCC